MNSLLAAGALFGASLMDQASSGNASSNKNSQIVDVSNSKRFALSKEEAAIANYLFSLANTGMKDSDDNEKINEIKLMSKTLASYVCRYKSENIYEVLSRMGILKSSKPFIPDSKVSMKAAEYSRILLNNPESIKWNPDTENSPVIFALNGNTPSSKGFEYKARIKTKNFTYYSVKKINTGRYSRFRQTS